MPNGASGRFYYPEILPTGMELLESATEPARTVHWPDGQAEIWPTLPIDCWHTLDQGNGEPVRIESVRFE